MKVAVIGAGILGLVLARRLAREGHEVALFEAAPVAGGLARPRDYGPFTWDAFYHCILPQDAHLLRLVDELGLGGALRWRRTGTGYFARDRFFDMSGNADFLRFPLLGPLDKARLAATVLWATRFADPLKLYRTTARDWLTRACGRRTYDVFWRPLLRAKFGPYADRVAAVFIWATLTRLMGARRGAAHREQLGYVSGGYARILGALVDDLGRHGATLHLGAALEHVEPAPGGALLAIRSGGRAERLTFDQVFFTGPTRLAARVAAPAFADGIARVAAENPTSAQYLGVVCLNLVLKRPLTPYYVLNIGDTTIPLTGVIEMTNLVDREAETGGLSLVYLPRYLDSADPSFDAPDEALRPEFEAGLARLFPGLSEDDVVARVLERARFVQPLPLVQDRPAERTADAVPGLARPFQVLNTSLLRCATLNNNEVVGLVDAFCARNAAELAAGAQHVSRAPA